MEQEAVNTSVNSEVESPSTETPDYNSFDYDETQEVAPVEEPAAVEDEVVEQPAAAPEADEESATPEGSPRYEKRIRQLSAKVRELKANAPAEAVAPATPQPIAPQPVAPSVSPRELPEGDYSREEINAWIQAEAVRTGQALSSIEVQQLRAELAAEREITHVQKTYDNELHAVETKYAALNEDSPEFDAHLAQVVTEIYEDQFQADPKTASLVKVADRIMAINQRTATKSAAAAAKAVATQRTTSAPAPSAQGPTSANSKWTAEAVEALSEDEYVANESAIKRDLYGL